MSEGVDEREREAEAVPEQTGALVAIRLKPQ